MTPEAASLLRKYYKQQDPILAEQMGMLKERRAWRPTVGAVLALHYLRKMQSRTKIRASGLRVRRQWLQADAVPTAKYDA